MQVNSPYPLSVIRLSSPSHTRVTYRIFVLPDYHCPPEQPFADLNVSFASAITHQEELVSVTFLESDLTCPDGPASVPFDTPTVPYTATGKGLWSRTGTLYFPYIVVTVVVVTLATIVICLALSKSSTHSNSGFSAHLPPGSTSHPTFSRSPMASPISSPQQSMHHMSSYQTPAFHPHQQQHTPSGVLPGSGAPGSAYKRTGFSSSPQHGLFSQ